MRAFCAILLALLLVPLSVGPARGDPVSDFYAFARCYDYLLQDTLVFADAWAPGSSDLFHQVKCKLKLKPAGIVIDGNSDFTVVNAQGVRVPNSANGVVGGTGSYGDPYLIMGHEWNGALPASCPALTITNTNAFVRVTGNWFHDGACSEGMVVVRNADRVTVDTNRFSANAKSVYAENGALYNPRIEVARNRFEDAYSTQDGVLNGAGQGTAVHAYNFGGGFHVHRNTIVGAGGDHGIFSHDSYAIIERNAISGDTSLGAIYVTGTQMNAFIDWNSVTDPGTAISAYSLRDSTWTRVDVGDNAVYLGGIQVGAVAGIVSIGGNQAFNTQGTAFEVYAHCNVYCAEGKLTGNTVTVPAWGRGAVFYGAGTISGNTFGAASSWGSVGIQFGDVAGSSNAVSVTSNGFGWLDAEFECTSAAIAIAQSGNSFADGALTKPGCA